MLVKRHCLDLWSIGSQFIISMFSSNLFSVIQLKAKVYALVLFLYFLFKFGYQTAVKVWLNKCISHFLLIRIHSMQGGTASLKVLSATFVQVYFLSLNKSTCQTRKNVFYFTSKALFVHEKIKF